jgi:hypothetical protein
MGHSILDRIASDPCQARAGLQGIELASISQRVMRTSDSDLEGPVSISRNGEVEYRMGTAASVRLDVGRDDHLAPFVGLVRN